MGQYYKAVNIDKQESISAYDFGSGVKLMESCYVGNPFVDALTSLIAGPWKGDRIMYVGDYAWDSICEGYSGFSRAQLLSDLKDDGVLASDPYDIVKSAKSRFTLPAREGWNGDKYTMLPPQIGEIEVQSYRYVVNLDEGIYYDRTDMPVAFTWKDDEGIECETQQDALLLLLAVGSGLGSGDYRSNAGEEHLGSWACDKLTATNDEPSGLEKIQSPFDPKA